MGNKNFKNFYDRISDFIPPNIVCDVSNGEKKYKIDALEVKYAYADWMEEVIKTIDSMDGISKKNKDKIMEVVNATCLSHREKFGQTF